jgi:TolB-like protein
MERKPGEKLGPYDLVSPIGKGGMGEVWKARDTRLQRDVAIKFCSNRFSDRFLREARAIAALNHPNICTLFDIGPDYLVMEYIEGAPPRGPLAAPAAVRLALGIAGALEAAHGKGITHRDLKPANVLVTQAGVKLLDFGLALVNDNSGTDIDDTATSLTAAGAIMGTAAYMSPEQAQGQPVDARSDIFSFGLVLYELLTGHQALAANSVGATMAAIIRDEPAPLRLSDGQPAPPKLSEIVTRCLRKLPSARFQTMSEVRAALEQISSVRIDETPSIAVLPFANMSRDPDDEYFSDGLAEEILNLLAKIPGLRVIARTSSFAFRGKEQDITGIAEALRVRTVLEGSVRRSGNRIRVTAQLIEAENGSHLWSERYDRDMTDVFAMQDEMSAAIVDALKLKLAPPKAPQRPVNLDAYHALLKSRHAVLLVSPDNCDRALAYADEAIALDSRYAPAHAARSLSLFLVAQIGRRPVRETLPLARAAALRALELDENLSEAHAILAIIAAVLDYDWNEALRHHRLTRVEELTPPVTAACATMLLFPAGRFHEGIELLENAVARDPLAAPLQTHLGALAGAAGEFERGTKQLLQTLEFHQDDFLAYFNLGVLYTARGMTQAAVAILEKGAKSAPWFPPIFGLLAASYRLAGSQDKADALLMLPQMASVAGHPIVDMARANYHVVVGDFERATAHLDRVMEARHFAVLLVAFSPIYKEFRQTPGGRALLARMNLSGTNP